MGGGLDADLSREAVPALCCPSPPAEGWHPVLQVADVTHVPGGTGLWIGSARARYHLLLSDGVYSQHAALAPALYHLATGDDLRRGSVVRLLGFSPAPDPEHVRTIVIFKLKILQIECALIGSLKLYEPPKNSELFSTRSSVAPSERPPVWKLVGQIKDENLAYSDEADLVSIKATISFVDRELLYYDACPLVVNGKRCNARATRVDGMWHCYSCDYYFLQPSEDGWSVRIQIQDHTGMISATVGEEAVEDIFGCKGMDFISLKYKDDIMMSAVCKQYVFQLKVQGRGHTVECIVLKAEKVNPSAECADTPQMRALQQQSAVGRLTTDEGPSAATGPFGSLTLSAVRRLPKDVLFQQTSRDRAGAAR